MQRFDLAQRIARRTITDQPLRGDSHERMRAILTHDADHEL
jgi:hypothetical protein